MRADIGLILQQPHPTHAAAFITARKNQVIEHRHVDQLTGLRQHPGGAAIRPAWLGVAARVVVGQDNPRGAQPRRVGDDGAHWQVNRARLAVEAIELDAAR